MNISASKKLKTGIFVLSALAILLLTIFLIGKRKSLFTDTFPVTAYFKNVSGLQAGNFVRFAGINIGTVNDIEIKNDSTVKVSLLLQTRIKPYIKSDSKVTIANDGLMGDKLISITAGSDSSTALNKEGVVTAVNPMDMGKVMDKLGIIANDAQVITSNLADILYKMNNGKGSLGHLLNDDKFSRTLEQTMQTANKTVTSIDKAAKGVGDNMEAAKHNFLFKGYFKKKEKQRIKDSTDHANSVKPVVKPADKRKQ